MGCDCSNQMTEQGEVTAASGQGGLLESGNEVRRSNIEKSSTKKEVQVYSNVIVEEPESKRILFVKDDETKNVFEVSRDAFNSNVKVTTRQASRINQGWISVAVGSRIFQVSNQANLNSARWVSPDSSAVEDAQRLSIARQNFSLTNLMNQYIFVAGGSVNDNSEVFSSVERYNVSQKQWEVMPSLNKARFNHASCIFDMSVFVFCGVDSSNSLINSVEYLDNADASPGQLQWKEIFLPTNVLSPRELPGAVSIDGSSIVIFGGIADNGVETTFVGDLIVFEPEKHSGQKVVPDMDGLLQFACFNNQSAQLSDGTVVALGENADDDKSYIVSYSLGQKMIKKVQVL